MQLVIWTISPYTIALGPNAESILVRSSPMLSSPPWIWGSFQNISATSDIFYPFRTPMRMSDASRGGLLDMAELSKTSCHGAQLRQKNGVRWNSSRDFALGYRSYTAIK